MKLNIKISTYVFDMCEKQVEHYTKVINSCETREQVQTVRPWIVDGFKGLRSIAENLPRRRRKLCLAVVDASRDFVLNMGLSKALDFFQKELKEAFDVGNSEAEMGEKIGSLFEGLAGMFPGKVRCEVSISRKRSAAKDPVEGESSDAERPERERPEATDPDPANPAEKPAESGAVS